MYLDIHRRVITLFPFYHLSEPKQFSAAPKDSNVMMASAVPRTSSASSSPREPTAAKAADQTAITGTSTASTSNLNSVQNNISTDDLVSI